MKEILGLKSQKIKSETRSNYAYMVVEIIPKEFGLTRDQVYSCMRKEGIMVRKYFYPLISNYSYYKALPSANKKLLPNANKVSERTLCLPLYEDLKQEEVNAITELIFVLHTDAPEIKNKF